PLFFLLFLICTGLQAQISFDKTKLSQLFDSLAFHDRVMGTLSIMEKGEIVYDKAIGKSLLEPPIASLPNTTYRIGSLTNMFTAVMIFQLIDAKKLSLDTPLYTYYPQLPNAKEITITHLLTHQSGMYNLLMDSTYQTWYQQSRPKAQMVDLLSEREPIMDPGYEHGFNPTNYLILGYIIEDISGKPYEKVLKKQVIKKAKLKNTSAAIEYTSATRSYYYEQYAWYLNSITHPSVAHGAGAIVSTPQDINRFMTALFEGALVSQRSLDTMTTIDDGFGHGLFQFPIEGKSAYGHNGGIDAFAATVSYFPDSQTSITLCTNGSNYSLIELMRSVFKIYFGGDYDIPSFELYQPSAKELKQYEGEYVLTRSPVKMTLRVKDGILMAYSTKESGFPLSPLQKDSFEFNAGFIKMDFLRDGQQQISGFLMDQNGRPYQFQKM
ncbi:MAG: serine hydrolase domain-containing protein, partial [Bacteroidota bacterium]